MAVAIPLFRSLLTHALMPHITYVRRTRRRWALSQPELAQLLGISQSVISRIEAGELIPGTSLALGLQVIFGQSPRALFPGLYSSVEDAVMAQAAELDRALGARKDYATETKRRLLTAMALRASASPSVQ